MSNCHVCRSRDEEVREVDESDFSTRIVIEAGISLAVCTETEKAYKESV